jgi:LysM repeat protein
MFALAFAVSLGFVVANGGLVLTAAVPTSTAGGSVLGEVETSAPTALPTPAPATPSPTAVATPSPGPTPSPAPTPSPSPTATPSPTPSPTPTPATKASASRLALLKPCSDAPNCYVYVIRSGDNMISIANYFGVSLTTVKAMNPWTKNGLTIGRGLRIPTPTR